MKYQDPSIHRLKVSADNRLSPAKFAADNRLSAANFAGDNQLSADLAYFLFHFSRNISKICQWNVFKTVNVFTNYLPNNNIG